MTPAAVALTRERRRLAFTPFALKRLPVPQGGQVDYWDNSTPGFGLRLTSKGTRSWVAMTRLLGHATPTRFTIGRAAAQEGEGGLTLAQARSKWLALKQRIRSGEDPRQTEAHAHAEAIRRHADTFETVAKDFLARHHPRSKPTLRSTTLRRYRGLLTGSDLTSWQSRPLSSLTRADVIHLLHRMQQRGVGVSANRALAVLRKMMSWAIQQNVIEHSPCDHIQAPAAEMKRTRHLFGSRLYNRPSELGLLWQACEAVGPLGALPKLLMLTGQRLSEVAEMQQEELIDLEGSQSRWHIPGARTKNGKDQVVPLAPLAVQLIRAVPRIKDCPYLFSTTGATPFSGFTNFKKRIDRELTRLATANPTRYAKQFAEPWVFHDLRRTFKTGLAELGIPSDIRDALVNHTPQGVEAHYNHAEYEDAKRAAMRRWEEHIRTQIEADKPTN